MSYEASRGEKEKKARLNLPGPAPKREKTRTPALHL